MLRLDQYRRMTIVLIGLVFILTSLRSNPAPRKALDGLAPETVTQISELRKSLANESEFLIHATIKPERKLDLLLVPAFLRSASTSP